jgi:hypothetical protein
MRAAERPEATQASHQRPAEVAAEIADYDTADYIAKMSAELAKLASGAGLDTLTYLLNLARIEAELHVAKFSAPPN